MFQTATELFVANKIAIKGQSNDTKVNVLHWDCIMDITPPPDFVFKENNAQFFTISINDFWKGSEEPSNKSCSWYRIVQNRLNYNWEVQVYFAMWCNRAIGSQILHYIPQQQMHYTAPNGKNLFIHVESRALNEMFLLGK